METYCRHLLWTLPIETYCGKLLQRPVEGCWGKIRILCKLGFLMSMTSSAVVINIPCSYYWLFLANIDLLGDNKELEVWDTI